MAYVYRIWDNSTNCLICQLGSQHHKAKTKSICIDAAQITERSVFKKWFVFIAFKMTITFWKFSKSGDVGGFMWRFLLVLNLCDWVELLRVGNWDLLSKMHTCTVGSHSRIPIVRIPAPGTQIPAQIWPRWGRHWIPEQVRVLLLKQ